MVLAPCAPLRPPARRSLPLCVSPRFSHQTHHSTRLSSTHCLPTTRSVRPWRSRPLMRPSATPRPTPRCVCPPATGLPSLPLPSLTSGHGCSGPPVSAVESDALDPYASTLPGIRCLNLWCCLALRRSRKGVCSCHCSRCLRPVLPHPSRPPLSRTWSRWMSAIGDVGHLDLDAVRAEVEAIERGAGLFRFE